MLATEVEAGRIVEVACASCGEHHEASVFTRGKDEVPFIVGIVWV